VISPRFLSVVAKQVVRHRTRSLLTIAGVSIAMFLFITVQTVHRGVQAATTVTAADQMLIVYRENRFCPATSRLPEYYGDRITRVAGVADVVPMKIVVTNCAASLDVVTFRGVRAEKIAAMADEWEWVEGSLDEWYKRSDAAIVGERLASRRGFRAGQSFDAAGVTVTVAGVIRSPQPQDQDVAYVHLEFLQRSAARGGLGIVTQFNVRVEDPALLDPVAKAIDAEFRHDSEPTQTRPERAFVAQAGSDIVEIVGFTRYVGWGCLAAVLALVANAIVLSVRDRIREHAVLQTLGYRGGLVTRLIMSEGIVIGLIGGAVGSLAALALIRIGNLSLYSEGLSITVVADGSLIVVGLVISGLAGALAGLVPAWRAGRSEIAHSFRAV